MKNAISTPELGSRYNRANEGAAKPVSTGSALPPALKAKCRCLLEELCSSGTYRRLEAYGKRRLVILQVSTITAGDLLNEAICSVLVGLDDSKIGRHPREDDLNDLPAFEAYMANVIKSISSGARRRQSRWLHLHESENTVNDADSNLESIFVCIDRPDRHVEILDFQDEFFRRLERRTSGRLRKLAKRWQSEADSADSIPLRGYHRQYRANLRRIAEEVIAELRETHR